MTVLVTYNCLHFALSPSTEPLLNTLRGTILPLYTPPSFKSNLVTHHLRIPTHCPNIACYSLKPSEWHSRITSSTSHLQKNLTSFRDGILHLGKIYHTIPLDTRVAMADDGECGLAHRQFGVEKRSWVLDPGFRAYREAKDCLEDIEKVLSEGDLWSPEGRVEEVAGRINECRGLIARIRGFEEEIEVGVTKLHHVATERMNEVMGDGDSASVARERRASDVEAIEKLKAVAKRKEEMDRRSLSASTAKTSKRAFVMRLLEKIKEKGKSRGHKLSETAKPKYFGRKEKEVDSVLETASRNEVSTASRNSLLADPKPERKASTVGSPGRRSQIKSKPKGIPRKKLLSQALEVSFHERMEGF